MKIKELGLPKKKEIYIPTDEQVGNGAYYELRELKGYNQALTKIGEINLVLDEGKIRESIDCWIKHIETLHMHSANDLGWHELMKIHKTQLSSSLSQAGDIIKLKE